MNSQYKVFACGGGQIWLIVPIWCFMTVTNIDANIVHIRSTTTISFNNGADVVLSCHYSLLTPGGSIELLAQCWGEILIKEEEKDGNNRRRTRKRNRTRGSWGDAEWIVISIELKMFLKNTSNSCSGHHRTSSALHLHDIYHGIVQSLVILPKH